MNSTASTFNIDDWNSIAPHYEELLDREISSPEALAQWLIDRSNLEGKVYEGQAWIYINKQRDTSNKDHAERYNNYYKNIMPRVAPYRNKLNEKLVNDPNYAALNTDKYFIYFRSIENELKLFNEKNIPIYAELSKLSSRFSKINGDMSVEMEGEEVTIQQAMAYMDFTNRELRKEAWVKVYNRRKESVKDLDDVFDDMKNLRHQIALNAGEENFTKYMFKQLGRFDYTEADCIEFHNSIREVIVPMSKEITEKRKEQLGYEKLHPWDGSVDPLGRKPLRPFSGGKELTDKSAETLAKTHEPFGEYVRIMDEKGYLDLESRLNKAPGGFLYPLPVSNIPFIYMNAVGKVGDITTIIHESGHATHSFLMKDLELNAFKHVPSEVAEFASMAMELLTLDNWDIFFENEEELKRAKHEHLEKIIGTFPWTAMVDGFQHWIYNNPEHTADERREAWIKINENFSTGVVDYQEYEDMIGISWQRQLHIFEIPFYYIEYAMAQLGAIAIWKQYKENPERAIENYQKALSLGYTKTIGEIYAAAEIEFNFSKEYVAELMDFVQVELKKLA